MTEQEKRGQVIKGLECCNGEALCIGEKCPYFDDKMCVETLHSDTLALLKAQEPVEPTLRGGIGGYWYCGACNYQISRGDKFCRYCGQAVKWE